MINTQTLTKTVALWWAAWRDRPEPLHKLLAREGNAINALFARHGVHAYVKPRGCVHSQKANFVRHEVFTDEKHNKITGLEKEIRAELYKARGDYPRVRFTEPLLYIETDHPAGPLPLRWSDANLDKLRSKEMLIGNSYKYKKARPATVDFADDTIAHVLGAAKSGGGKTMLLLSMILSLARSTSPRFATFVVLDPKNDKKLRTLDALSHLPHGVTRGMDDCLVMLDRLVAEKDRRTREDVASDLYIFVDEFLSFTDGGKETKEKFGALAHIGRGLGMHLIMYAQNPLAEKMGDAKANVSVTIGGAVRAKNNEVAVFGPGVNSGAERLPGKGSFLVMREDGDLERVQTFLIEGDDAKVEVFRIIDKWEGSEAAPIAEVAESGPALPKGVSQAEIDCILAEHTLDDLVDDKGEWRDGMKAAVARCRSEDKGDGANYAWANKVKNWLVKNAA